MKLSIVVIALTMTTQSFGQVKFGVRAGLNLANMTVKDLGDAKLKMNTSFHVGGIVEYSLAETFSIESGLLLSEKGTKEEYSLSLGSVTITGAGTISPLYLEIPINALYKVDLGSAKLHLFAGPYIGIGIGGKAKIEYTATGLPSDVTLSSLGIEDESADIKFGTEDDSDLKGTDFGLNIGAGIEIKNLLVRAQYGLGLSNLDPKGLSVNDTKNRVIGISLGYMFGGK